MTLILLPISLKLSSSISIFRKFVHWALGGYYYLKKASLIPSIRIRATSEISMWKDVPLRVPPGLNSLTPTIYGNPMITMLISVIDNQNHICIWRIWSWQGNVLPYLKLLQIYVWVWLVIPVLREHQGFWNTILVCHWQTLVVPLRLFGWFVVGFVP